MTETSDRDGLPTGFRERKIPLGALPASSQQGNDSQEAHRRRNLFEGRKRLRGNGLVVMEEAASERRQSRRADQDDD